MKSCFERKFKTVNLAFTIVELLVVIVVIGILTTVTIVSYSGITARAYNAKAISVVDTYEKIFEMYFIENNMYPGDDSGKMAVCLGSISDYPENDDFEAGQCYSSANPIYNIYASDTLSSAISSFLGSPPVNGLLPTVTISNNKYRGAFYSIDNSMITYAMNGEGDCARGEKYYDEEDGITFCDLFLANESNPPPPKTCEELGNCQ